MKAYIYGYITATGTKITNASSDGFSCQRTNIGVYKVTFTTSPGSSAKYIVLATAINNGGPITCTVVKYNSYFNIYVWNKIAKAADNSIQFVVYKK